MGILFRNRNKCIIAFACLFMAAMAVFPQVTGLASKSAIIIWANAIVPVLLPFFIFSEFIRKSGIGSRIPPCLYPLAMAFLSGYPMGARVSANLVSRGDISLAEGKWILSFSMVTGPAFLMGTIGSFLGNVPAAAVAAAAHYGGAVLNGILWHEKGVLSKSAASCASESPVLSEMQSLLECFTGAILAAFRSMAVILAWLIIFMVGMGMMEHAGLFRAVGNETVCSVLKGLLEMTAGTSMVGACNISLEMKTVLCAFLVSFGGLSVIGQSASMTAGSGITGMDILKRKVTHGLFAGFLAVITMRFVL